MPRTQALRGYFSMEWRQMASEGVFDNDKFHEGRGHQTLKRIHMATHELTTTIWKARCKVLHDGNSPDLRAIRDTEIAEITDLYTNQDLIGVGDRHYCARPMATILQKAPSTRRRWL